MTAIGGQIGYTFKIGEILISTNVRVLREFNATNRFEGTATYLTISAPLWVAPGAPVADAKPVMTNRVVGKF